MLWNSCSEETGREDKFATKICPASFSRTGSFGAYNGDSREMSHYTLELAYRLSVTQKVINFILVNLKIRDVKA